MATEHMPRLDTVLMVEDTIKRLDLPTKTDVWRALPRMVMWRTFLTIMEYLEASNRIVVKGGRISWIVADNPRLLRLIERSVPYRPYRPSARQRRK